MRCAKRYRYLNRDDLKEIEDSLKSQSEKALKALCLRALSGLPKDKLAEMVAQLQPKLRGMK